MWPYPKIIAHRGGGIMAPENTLAGIRAGLARGFHAVEFDVMLAQDGVPILMHDPELGRTVAGSGLVCEYTARQLAAMDAGAWMADEFRGEPVPGLHEVLEFCLARRIWMNIEIKPAPGWEAETGRVTAEMVARLLARQIESPQHGDMPLPLFSSFIPSALQAAREAAPDIPRGLLMERIPTDWRQALNQVGARALHANHKHLLPAQARAVKEAGYGLMCYTVNEAARARQLLGWGVDAFCTDRIDLFSPDFADHWRSPDAIRPGKS
jgi:glycerophosphoryl diester phosphodiesterase